MTSLTVIMDKYKKLPLKVVQDACVELSARVYDRTPVDTGLLQSSWTPSLNQYDHSNSGGSFPAVAYQMKAGDSYRVMNSQPYVRRIEYEGWSHTKAPRGMLRISIAEFDSIVATAVRENRGS